MENSAWTIIGTPEGSTKTIRNIALITAVMFLFILWASPGIAVIGVLFLAVGVYNTRFSVKRKGYIACNDQFIEWRNNYLPSFNKNLPISEIEFINFRRKNGRGGISWQLEFVLKSGQKQNWVFEEFYRPSLEEFKQLAEQKGLKVWGDLSDERSSSLFGKNSFAVYTPVFLLAQLVLLAGFFAYAERESEAYNQSIAADPAFAVAVTTDIVSPNHGSCNFVYTYSVNGKSYTGESSSCVDCSPNADSLHRMRDMDLAVKKTGAQFMVVYKKEEPSTHRFLLERYLSSPEDSARYVKQGIKISDLN